MQWIEQWGERSDLSVRIIAFGSSNTELSWSNEGRHNWFDWLGIGLRSHIGRHIHVINQGIAGDTADMLLKRIDRDVVSYRPAVVIVTIGGNDAIGGVPTAVYAGQLRKICSILQSNGAMPVLQTYYCPVYREGRDGFVDAFEANMQANRDLAKELGLPLIDQYSRFEPFYRRYPDDYAKLMRDWMHVNHLGNLLMAQNLCDRFGIPSLSIPAELFRDVDMLFARMNECSDPLVP
jgi:lysophospholipase L1-like esterase